MILYMVIHKLLSRVRTIGDDVRAEFAHKRPINKEFLHISRCWGDLDWNHDTITEDELKCVGKFMKKAIFWFIKN